MKVRKLLPGLDEDIAEYISGILDDDGALEPDSLDDTTATIAGLLGEYCEEKDEDPSDKAEALIARLLTQENGGQPEVFFSCVEARQVENTHFFFS